MPLVSSLRGPWGESGRRATPSLGGWGEYGPTLRQCLSFADPRNQAVRAVASRRVPGARSCQGACGLCPPDQKARPGGCLLRAPSAQLQPTWQPWPHPRQAQDAIAPSPHFLPSLLHGRIPKNVLWAHTHTHTHTHSHTQWADVNKLLSQREGLSSLICSGKSGHYMGNSNLLLSLIRHSLHLTY